MVEMVLRLHDLPTQPLDAAAYFYTFPTGIPAIRADLAGGWSSPCHFLIVFEPAGHEHRAWRLAAIQELARELAPHRINAVASASEPAIKAARAYLAAADGVTGQYLQLDDDGAGSVVESAK